MFEKEDGMDVFIESLVTGDTGSAIMRQEKRGQGKMVNAQVFPRKWNSGTRQQIEQMGVVFGEDADELFSYVTLPDGWEIKPTEHSMWSVLLDNKGRERASIFYKAAFYDRDAFFNTKRRYEVAPYQSADEAGNPTAYGEGGHLATYILDGGELMKLIAVRSKGADYSVGEQHEKLAYNWLKENFPDYNDVLAYWD